MKERRRDSRLPVNISLTIESLYNQEKKLEDINDTIKVVDLSKGGIAFEAEDDIPIDFYFNSRITIDEDKSFFCVLKIIRKDQEEGIFRYGCEFVGFADVLGTFIDEYREEIEK